MISIYSIPKISGVFIVIYGMYIFQDQMYRSDKDTAKEYNHRMILYVAMTFLVIFTTIQILILYDFDTSDQIILDGILVIVAIIAGGSIYQQFSHTKVGSDLINTRIKLSNYVYLFCGLFVSYSIFVYPTAEDLSKQFLRNSTVEILMLVDNIWAIVVSTILSVIVIMPQFIQQRFGISGDEILEKDYTQIGIDEPNTILVDPEVSEQILSITYNLKDTGNEYIYFFNTESELEANLFKGALSQYFTINHSFETLNMRSQAYNQHLRKEINHLIVATELDNALFEWLRHIERIYEWQIYMEDGKIELNNYVYKLEGYKFGLIFKGLSPWDSTKELYFLLFDNALNTVMKDFIDNYFEFITDITGSPAYTIIIFFELDKNGNPKPVPPSREDTSIPHPQSYKIFEY